MHGHQGIRRENFLYDNFEFKLVAVGNRTGFADVTNLHFISIPGYMQGTDSSSLLNKPFL